LITLNDTHTQTNSVGLLWTSDQPVEETSMPPDGIRNRHPSKPAASNPRLRRRSHWDRLNYWSFEVLTTIIRQEL